MSQGPTIATIGVYGFDAGSFLRRLRDAEVELVLDVRQRRGVRGSEYTWANARRLQEALADAGIFDGHLPELAPTTELRNLQYASGHECRDPDSNVRTDDRTAGRDLRHRPEPLEGARCRPGRREGGGDDRGD